MQLGNLHPLFVHLPIGILVLAFLMELYYYKKPAPKDNGTILFALAIGAFSAIFSVASGWFLGENGGYDEELLFRHRWIAVAFSVGALILFFLKKSANGLAQKTYFPVFVLVLILLTLTGHFGGSLTHGEDFLFKEAYEEPVIEDIAQAVVFSDVIQPILQQKCVSCHNSGKAKGGLLLTSQKELLAGGDSGSLLDSLEKEKTSLLMHRLYLPMADKEHMPPKGKVQLTSEEVLLMNWWMKNENCFDCVVKNLPTDEKLDAILASLEKDNSLKALIAEKVDDVPLEFIAGLSQSNISAQLASEEMPLLFVNFLKRKNLSDEDFDLLKPYKDNIVEINLGYTNLTDELAKRLKQFKHLTKLQLQNTGITNATVQIISNLEFLESLNLYGSELDDSALNSLATLPNLKNLYVWQTKMTKDGLSEFQKENETIMVQSRVADSVFASSTLSPPTIIADQEIFKDSVKISIEQYFEGAKVFYITENSKNDTIAKEYTEPFYLKETSTLKTYSTLDNWEPSLTSTAHFLKNQVEINNITLAQSPHPKYTAKGGETLMDLKRGTTNFVDGNWVGYESQHMTATVEFKEQTTISNISVGSLSIPTSWIFFPVGYTVWGSADGNSFKKIKTIKLPKPTPSIDIERMAYNISFDPISLKKVKLFVESPLKNPDWHIAPGGNSFIFLDELVFN
ncbi:hypothetical protein DKG77_01215 [Flagellimonas aquimarina]|uniref:Uncharacterized protein n=1 Tax=Flagellimonas aquimarina TaxID=2201895 RepID=A0A316L0Q4_9FLAO|nr:DUF2231 domain-containing protein [Allomuricauda koreensis]PWL39486.1 hypothetical protein DKG77_01215 [Allomuricauda koreensis]